MNLYIIKEVFTNGSNDINLYIISTIAILCAIYVIVTKNPVISILYLITLFLSISCYLIMLGLSFIGLSYLLVYIGAVSILFIFILMLINIRVSELSIDNTNSIPLAILVGISFNNVFSDILPYSTTISNLVNNDSIMDNNILEKLNLLKNKIKAPFIYLNTWEGNLWENSHISSLGNVIYSTYSIWLILTSIILLLAMVGAIVITIKPR